MRIVEAKLERFSGELAAPPANAHHHWTARRGLLLRLLDEKGHLGQGEATPLPGYSPDDVDTCRAALQDLDWDELTRSRRGAPLLEALAVASSRLPPELPAARFAVETALLDLAAQRAGRPAWALLRSSVRRLESRPLPIALCGLLALHDPGERAVLDAASELVLRGLTTLKLKVGQEGDIELAHALRRRVGDRILLRFDANGAWSEQQAPARLAGLASVVPELVEEPTSALLALHGSPVALALDESLQVPGALERLRPAFRRLRVEAIVLKPATLGLLRCVELASRAQSSGLGVSVSHLFDGPVALAAAAALALAVASPERASGLDRHAGLSAWPAVRVAALGDTHINPTDSAGLGVDPLPEGETS